MSKIRPIMLAEMGLWKEYDVLSAIEQNTLLDSRIEERIDFVSNSSVYDGLYEMSKKYSIIIIQYNDVLMTYNFKVKSLSIRVNNEMVESYILYDSYLFYGICEFLMEHPGFIITGMNI